MLAAIGLSLPALLLVFVQPDIGTALVYAAALAAVLFVAGARWLHLAIVADRDRADRRDRGALASPPSVGRRRAQAVPADSG